MDPLTHGVLGASISYAFFGRKLGKQAALIGFLGGIAPDIDHFVSSKDDALLYVEYHRGITHSLPFSFLGAFIVTLPWLIAKQFREKWRTLWACAWPAYLSHGLLDASTTYGTQLLMPFSRNRSGWDLIAVVDPMFTLPLAVLLVIALKKIRPTLAMAAFIFALSYLSLGGLQKWRAAKAQEQLAASRGHRIERWEVMPTLANLIVWRSLYLSGGQFYSDRLRLGVFSETTYREGSSRESMSDAALNELEKRGNTENRAFTRFSWFSDSWVARSPVDEAVIADMRYSISTKAFDPIWGIRFYETNKAIKVEWVNRTLKRKMNVSELWSEIDGTHPEYKALPKPSVSVP